MSIKKTTASFMYAFRGIAYVFKTEQNFRLHTAVGLVVLGVAGYLKFSLGKMSLLVLVIMLVLMMEMVNTALERFTDLLKPRLHHYVSTVKDIMAGVVLITAVGAVVIGAMLFLPYLLGVGG